MAIIKIQISSNHLIMRVLITGATGFIGRHTLERLVASGHRIAAIHRGNSMIEPIPSGGWVCCPIDNPDWETIETILGGTAEVLVHLAAHGVNPTESDWTPCFQLNVVAALSLWQQAATRGVKRIILGGSCFEYGRSADRYEFIPEDAPLEPLGSYAASKAASTMALYGITAQYGLEALVLRPCVVFGEGEPPYRLWPSLRRAAQAGEDFPMTSGQQVRDFVPVEHVADALTAGVTRCDLPSGILRIENIGSGQPQSVIDFATEWWRHWNGRGKLLPGVIPARGGEVMRFVPRIAAH
jgi:nucleoside-diphosphate-sugar epimerase